MQVLPWIVSIFRFAPFSSARCTLPCTNMQQILYEGFHQLHSSFSFIVCSFFMYVCLCFSCGRDLTVVPDLFNWFFFISKSFQCCLLLSGCVWFALYWKLAADSLTCTIHLLILKQIHSTSVRNVKPVCWKMMAYFYVLHPEFRSELNFGLGINVISFIWNKILENIFHNWVL